LFLDYFSKLLWTSCILHCAVLLFDDQYPNFWCVQIFHLCQTRKLCNDRQTLASLTCLALLPVATDGVQRFGRVQRLKRLELGFCTFGFYLFVICILLGCCLHLFWGREYFLNLFQMWVKAWLELREVRCLWYLRCKHKLFWWEAANWSGYSMSVGEEFVTCVTLVNEFFLDEEFDYSFSDCSDTSFQVSISPWGSNTGWEELCSQWLKEFVELIGCPYSGFVVRSQEFWNAKWFYDCFSNCVNESVFWAFIGHICM